VLRNVEIILRNLKINFIVQMQAKFKYRNMKVDFICNNSEM